MANLPQRWHSHTKFFILFMNMNIVHSLLPFNLVMGCACLSWNRRCVTAVQAIGDKHPDMSSHSIWWDTSCFNIQRSVTEILHNNKDNGYKINYQSYRNLSTDVHTKQVKVWQDMKKPTFMLTRSSPRYNAKPMRRGKLLIDRAVCRKLNSLRHLHHSSKQYSKSIKYV